MNQTFVQNIDHGMAYQILLEVLLNCEVISNYFFTIQKNLDWPSFTCKKHVFSYRFKFLKYLVFLSNFDEKGDIPPQKIPGFS